MLTRPLVLLTALATGLVATETYPSMRLAFHVKRASMAVYGQTDFDVFVNPIVATNSNGTQVVSYDGQTTIQDDSGVTYTLSLVERVPYYSALGTDGSTNTTCLGVDILPPVDQVLGALTSATVVDQVDTTQDISCTSGSYFQITFADEDFVLCSASDANGSFTAYGTDLNVVFSYLNETVSIEAPELTFTNGVCESLAESTTELTSAVEAVLTGQTSSLFGHRRRLHELSLPESPRRALLADSNCSCKGVKRPCVIYQGMDVDHDGGLVDSNKYFKGMEAHAPCCSSFKYAVLNTVDYGWNNDTLQEKLCGLAVEVSDTSTSTVIEDTIVISHSMAGLMVSGALANGKCSLAPSSTWISLSGVMRGTMGADFQQGICNGGTSVTSDVLEKLGALIGQCPGSQALKSMVYEGGAYATAAEDAQYAAAQAAHEKYAAASLCGDSFSGLVSTDYIGLWFAGLILPHHSKKNDGVVEFQSCVGSLSPSVFDNTYTSTNYRAAINHADSSFHNGDALFGNDKKPNKWLECLL